MEVLQVSDGWTTVSLLAAPHELIDYVPAVGDVVGSESGNQAAVVTDKIKAAFEGTPAEGLAGQGALAGAAMQRDALSRLLRQAERVAGGSGEARVFLYVQRAATSPRVRAEVFGGEVAERDEDGFWVERAVLRVVVTVKRAGLWEGEEVELACLDGEGAGHLGGVDILNTSGLLLACNWVELAPVTKGDAPAALRLAWSNQAAGYAVDQVLAGLVATAGEDALIFDERYEAESGVGGAVVLGGAAYSNGAYSTLNWNGTAETQLVSWTMLGLQVDSAAGRWFEVLARLAAATAYTDLQLQVRVLTEATMQELWRGPWTRVTAGKELVDLGNVRVPPFAGPSSGLWALRLEVWAKRATAGAHSIGLDYVSFMGIDGLRRYAAVAAAYGMGYLETLTDDPGAGLVYVADLSGAYGSWLVTGAPLTVRPGCRHRVSFWWSAGNVGRADKAARVQFWYRPRYALP